MAHVFHIAAAADWLGAEEAGRYETASLATEGFIHCSTSAQVVATANRHFRGRQDLVLLRIDAARVAAEVRHEAAHDGERFPHVHGPLNLDAVVGVAPFPPGADGRFELPAAFVDAG